MTIIEMIRKWRLETAIHPDNGLPALRSQGKLTAPERELLRAHKEEIIAELNRRQAERDAAEARRKAEEAAELAAIRAGAKPIRPYWRDGEHLSAWEISGPAAELLAEIGVAKYINGWGYRVERELIEALGKAFTYPQALERTRPARETKAAAEAAQAQERQAKFDEAREIGKPVVLRSWTAECNDRREQCSMDIVREYAMPDGGTKVERQHTW